MTYPETRQDIVEMYADPLTRDLVQSRGYLLPPTPREIAEYEIVDMSTEFFADMILSGLEKVGTSWSALLWNAVHEVPEWVWEDFLVSLRQQLEERGIIGKSIRWFCEEYKIDDVDIFSPYTKFDFGSTSKKVKMFECTVNIAPAVDSTSLCKWIYSCAKKEYNAEFNNLK